jgi:hypothetical protein
MKPKTDCKAYVVEGHQQEQPSVVVYAAGETHALLLGAGCKTLQHLSPANLHVSEIPSLKSEARETGPRVLDWDSVADLSIYRDLGWELTGAKTCKRCNKFECSALPASELVDGVCLVCSSSAVLICGHAQRGDSECSVCESRACMRDSLPAPSCVAM